MIEQTLDPVAALQHAIARSGFVVVPSLAMRELLTASGSLSDWDRFAASWNDLHLDTYMADGGRYRRRRHAVYTAAADGSLVRGPHRAHYQTLDYNPLHGGIARWFEPIESAVGEGPTMTTILRLCRIVFGSVERWDVEVHQFRIEARPDQEGRPTPEGIHRDGVDYVLVMLVARQNVVSGTTTIHDSAGRGLGSFTLTDPFEAVLLNDSQVWHGVTPVESLDPAKAAYRDVLVVTWKRQAAAP